MVKFGSLVTELVTNNYYNQLIKKVDKIIFWNTIINIIDVFFFLLLT